ncbi:hypothetical protein AVEN_62850-1 [Araneus ventricosus]|uniref:Uncharacterized protein n=1 Tax=Araneus ventricosus TaxID=182803 RepID=A0A4Y2QUR5_ARAVE|nr:hypothetical protein AVEN_62850-1 [Araneus ventricosus]
MSTGALCAVIRPCKIRTLRLHVTELLALKAPSRFKIFTVPEGREPMIQAPLFWDSLEYHRSQRNDPIFGAVLAFTVDSDRDITLRQGITLPKSADPFLLFVPSRIFPDRDTVTQGVKAAPCPHLIIISPY